MTKRKPIWLTLAPVLLPGLLALWAVPALAQDEPTSPAEEAEEEEQPQPAEESEEEEPKPAEAEEEKPKPAEVPEGETPPAPAQPADSVTPKPEAEAEAAPAQPVEATPAVEATPEVTPEPTAETPAPETEPPSATAETPPLAVPADAEAGAAAAASTGEVVADEGDIELDAIRPTARKAHKLFQIQTIYEVHANLISDDRSANDWWSWWLVKGNINLTRNDRVSLRMDLVQRYIADPGENGLWFGDLRFYYSRKFQIPLTDEIIIPGQATLYLTAPTSRQSRARDYTTRPTGILTVVPNYGPLTLVANGYFRYSFATHAESTEGDPNTQLTTGYDLQLIYAPLDWFAPSFAWQYVWHKPYDLKYADNSGNWESEYYFEFALNFTIPMPEAFPTLDVSLAYGQGANVKEDGIYRTYFAKRDQSEIYLGLNLSY